MIRPKILYNNVLRGLTPTFSGTAVSGKGPENSIDWQDFSFFTADTGNLDFTVGADTDIDSVAIYVATTAGSNSIELQYESAPSTFTSLKTFSTPSGTLDLEEFTGVTVLSGRIIRFVITAATTMNIRQLVVGEVMEAEQGQFASMTYPNLLGGVKASNTISQNGSILSRSIKRIERTGSLELEYLSASWIRSTWEPFAAHAARYPFIYQPDPTNRPTEVALAVASGGIEAPTNMGKGDLMSVQMKLNMLVADSLAI